MTPQNFPKDIYVSIENAGTEDEFRLVHEKAEDAASSGDDIVVGHYVLAETLVVTSEIKTAVIPQ